MFLPVASIIAVITIPRIARGRNLISSLISPMVQPSSGAAAAVNRLQEQVFLPDMERSVELTEPLPDNWLDHLAELLADSM